MSSQTTTNRCLNETLSRKERAIWGAATPAPGSGVERVAVAEFNPSADSTQRTIAAHGLGVRVSQPRT